MIYCRQVTELAFVTSVDQDKDGTWWFAHVPREVRERLKRYEKRGNIAVIATIGRTTWDASLMPWADGSAQIVLKKHVREAEDLKPHQRITIVLQPRRSAAAAE